MNNIVKMLMACLAATGEPVKLQVSQTAGGITAVLVGEDDLPITLQKDWSVELRVEADSVTDAIECLDALCAEDFR